MMERRNPAAGLNPGVEPTRFEAWRTFMQNYGVITDLMRRRFAETLDLPMVWYEILLHINAGPCRQRAFSELEELMVLSQSGLSQLVSRMEANGLLTRTTDTNDGRRTILMLTDAGADLFAECAAVHRTSINEYFADRLTDEEAAIIASAFGRILEEVTVLRREQNSQRPVARRRRAPRSERPGSMGD